LTWIPLRMRKPDDHYQDLQGSPLAGSTASRKSNLAPPSDSGISDHHSQLEHLDGDKLAESEGAFGAAAVDPKQSLSLSLSPSSSPKSLAPPSARSAYRTSIVKHEEMEFSAFASRDQAKDKEKKEREEREIMEREKERAEIIRSGAGNNALEGFENPLFRSMSSPPPPKVEEEEEEPAHRSAFEEA